MSTQSPTFRRPGHLPGESDAVATAPAGTEVVGRGGLFRLVRTDDSVAHTIARLGLGLVMLPHALQKVFGMFGGYGFAGTYGAFTSKMGLPGPIAFLTIAAELVCSIALILGVFTRIAALGILAIMVGAIVTVHLPNGFFMNWNGKQPGEGFEYHLLAIALALVCLVAGGGRGSIDRAITRRRSTRPAGVIASERFVTP